MFQLETTMSEDTSCGRGKDFTVFQKGEIIGLHQARITKVIAEIPRIGLRTVQPIIKAWKDNGELRTSWKKCGWKKNLEWSWSEIT